MIIHSIRRALQPQNLLITALIGLVVTAVSIAATVGTAQLKRNAVTTAKIKNNSITAAKLRRNAVTTAKIKNGAITLPKLKNGAVTGPKIRNNSITGAKIQEHTLGKVPAAAHADDATHASTATSASTANTAADAASLGGLAADQYVTRSRHVTWYKELASGQRYSVRLGPIILTNICEATRARIMIESPGVRGTSIRGTRTDGAGTAVPGGAAADLQASMLYTVDHSKPTPAERIMRLSLGLKSADGSVFVAWPGAGSPEFNTANVTTIAGPLAHLNHGGHGLATTSHCTFYGNLHNLAG